jgi:hypothetical protein
VRTTASVEHADEKSAIELREQLIASIADGIAQ